MFPLCLSLSLSKDAEIPEHDDGICYKKLRVLTTSPEIQLWTDINFGNVNKINNSTLCKERISPWIPWSRCILGHQIPQRTKTTTVGTKLPNHEWALATPNNFLDLVQQTLTPRNY